MNDLVKKLILKIEQKETFTGNEKELFLLDTQEFENKILEYENRIEELEWSEEDYFTIAKDTEFKKTIRKQFVTDSGEPCELFDYFTIDEINNLVEDIGDDLIKLMEKEHVNI